MIDRRFGFALVMVALGAPTVAGCQDPVESGDPGERSSAAEAAESPRRGAANSDDSADRETINPSASPEEASRDTVGEAGEADAPEEHTTAAAVPADIAAGRLEGEDAPEPAQPTSDDAENDPAAGTESTTRGAAPEIHNDVIDRFEISRFALARDIIDREPVGITDTFRRGSGPLHVFIEARNRTGDNVELRVGFSPAEAERRGTGVRLNVPSTVRYRTRARANTRRRPGEWLCLVTDDRGRTLVAQRFRIVKQTEE